MSKSTQPIPPGHEHLIPHLVCSPCAQAIEFYKKAFDARQLEVFPSPDGKGTMHAAIQFGDSIVMMGDERPGQTCQSARCWLGH